ncbi:50S ribosomal protein L19e [Candidatus Woesearchaeota archaeon]|nr:50S ribosomal protein L19e [Candidatus Woesearchaeota archaeon]
MDAKKILAGKILNISPHKVRFAPEALEDIRKAITRADIRGLIAIHKITAERTPFHSRGPARVKMVQKRKGRQRGKGSKKGTRFAIVTRKRQWINRIRVQRIFLQELRDKKLLTPHDYQDLYLKSKGGFFRNKRHIKLWLTEHNLIKK